jgi:hypothetical protein
MTAAATVTGGAPALPDLYRPLDRAHPTGGRRGALGQDPGWGLAELVDQGPQPTQLGGGQDGQEGDHHQHR